MLALYAYLSFSTYNHTLFCNKMALPLIGIYKYRHTWMRNFQKDVLAETAHSLGLLVPWT
jgi:hypothetical protein